MSRFRYPVSLPEDVAKDLGMDLPNNIKFQKLIDLLATPGQRPAKLRKYMPRVSAESTFESALKKETFKSCSLFYSFGIIIVEQPWFAVVGIDLRMTPEEWHISTEIHPPYK